MNEKIYRGKVVRWDDQKGFGFIAPESGGTEIFLHISALKRIGRRPAVGDRVQFEVHQQNDDRKRAVNVRIDGAAASPAPRPKPRPRGPYAASGAKKGRKWPGHLLVMAIIVIAGVFGYKRSPDQPVSSVIDPPPSVVAPMRAAAPRFQCAGKVYCSEMNSCAEATFYQRNCPGTKMDGDGDGVPCERQWCG